MQTELEPQLPLLTVQDIDAVVISTEVDVKVLDVVTVDVVVID